MSSKPVLHQHAFDEPLSEEAAYWTGFIAADGHVTSRGAIRINLAEKDRGHLERLRAFVAPEHHIGLAPDGKKGHLYCYLSFTSATAVRALRAAPAAGRESEFWRGYFDGDGGIYVGTKRVSQLQLEGVALPLAVLERLYGGASVFLPRKYDLWRRVVGEFGG